MTSTSSTFDPSPNGLPATLLLAPLGLVAMGLAWSEAAFVFSVPSAPGGLITGFAAGLMVLLCAVTAVPVIRHRRIGPDMPIALAGAGTTAVLLAAAALPRAPTLSLLLWGLGLTGLIAAATCAAIPLVRGRQDPLTLRPGLFVVPCGFLAAPIAGMHLDFHGISVMSYLVGLVLALALYAQTAAHAVSGWLLPEPDAIERAARTAPPAFAFFGYQGINGGFIDATALILVVLVLPTLGEFRPAVNIARRTPADPRSWLCVFTAAAAALLLLILYELLGGALLATISTLALAAATLTMLFVLDHFLSAATRGSAKVPYRQPPRLDR